MPNLTNYRLTQLDVRAIKYIESILTVGKELSSIVQQHVDLDDGSIFTILPKSHVEAKVYDFEQGGKINSTMPHERFKRGSTSYILTPIGNTDVILSELVDQYLQAHDEATCIFEDAQSKSGDPAIRDKAHDLSPPMATLGESVYYYFSSKKNNNIQDIQNAISRSNSIWHFVCVMATSHLAINENGETDIRALTEIVNDLQGIVVGAYDGESYLIWSKSSDFLQLLRGHLSLA